MAFEALNSILSTAVSITYTCCCAIVLMLHNVSHITEVANFEKQMLNLKINLI